MVDIKIFVSAMKLSTLRRYMEKSNLSKSCNFPLKDVLNYGLLLNLFICIKFGRMTYPYSTVDRFYFLKNGD